MTCETISLWRIVSESTRRKRSSKKQNVCNLEAMYRELGLDRSDRYGSRARGSGPRGSARSIELDRSNWRAIIQAEGALERMQKFWRPLTILGWLDDRRTGRGTREHRCAPKGRGRGRGRGTDGGKDAAGGRTPITVYRVGFHRGVESSIGEPGNRLAERQTAREWLLVVAASGIGLRNETKHASHKLSRCLARVKAGFVTLCTPAAKSRPVSAWRCCSDPQVRNPSSAIVFPFLIPSSFSSFLFSLLPASLSIRSPPHCHPSSRYASPSLSLFSATWPSLPPVLYTPGSRYFSAAESSWAACDWRSTGRQWAESTRFFRGPRALPMCRRNRSSMASQIDDLSSVLCPDVTLRRRRFRFRFAKVNDALYRHVSVTVRFGKFQTRQLSDPLVRTIWHKRTLVEACVRVG